MHQKHQRLTTDSFKELATSIHGKKYKYNKTEYKNSKTKVIIVCDTCGYEWSVLPHNHLSGSGCKKCQYSNLLQNQPISHETFLARAFTVHGNNFTYLSEYLKDRELITIQCNKCGDIFNQRASSHLSGSGCKKCQYSNLLQNQPKDVCLFESQCSLMHNGKYEYFQDYRGSRYKIKIRCKKHNYIFQQEASQHRRGQGCPKCDSSKGERQIESILDTLNIKFEREWSFDDCRNKYPLHFDFYLPEIDTIIEYDGEQHFFPIVYFGGKRRFLASQHNDAIKTSYCKNKHIRMIRIPFYCYDEIEHILTKILLLPSGLPK